MHKKIHTRGPIEERRLRRQLEERARRLVGKSKARPEAQGERHEDRFTPIDRQNSLEGHATIERLRSALIRREVSLKRKFESLLGRGRGLIRARTEATDRHTTAIQHLATFDGRFSGAVELMTGLSSLVVVGIYVFLVALLVPEFALNLPGFAFLSPPGGSGLLSSNLPAAAAFTYTAAQGIAAKFAGRHLAWGTSSLVVCVRRDRSDSRTPMPVVESEWTRRQHVALGAGLAAIVLVSVIGIVAVRVPALNLASQLAPGQASGVIGSSGATESVSGLMLLLISVLPLCVAGFLSGYVEGPQRSSRRKLLGDTSKPAEVMKKTNEALDKLGAAVANVIQALWDAQALSSHEQRVVVLEVLYRHDVMAEELPDFFGLYQTSVPAGYPDLQRLLADISTSKVMPESTADKFRETYDNSAGTSSEGEARSDTAPGTRPDAHQNNHQDQATDPFDRKVETPHEPS